ncbi:hypothetical protein AC1031_011617 [Aphanomyces cochlioides]|nr:hypothetical protein AC1031_011617 [Aphanomyces cochlioides]
MNGSSSLTSTTKRNGIAWGSDAVDQGSLSSLEVLLEWLTEDNNYARWRAGSLKKTPSRHATGSRSLPVVASKEKLCQEIVNKLHTHGLSHRSSREVRSKINGLERSYRAARDWTNSTGEGVLDEDEEVGQTDVRSKILKFCKHYDALHRVMGDRPVARPIYTNEDDDQQESVQEKECSNVTNDDDAALENVQSASSNRSASVSSTSSKRSVSVLDMWNQMTQVNAVVDKERTAIEKGKLEIETKRLRMDEEKTKWEIEIRRTQALKEKALAKLELKNAGMTDDEIAAIFD